MARKKVTDKQIKKMQERISNGESTSVVTEEFNISRQGYHQRLKKLSIPSTPKKNIDKLQVIDTKKLTKISNMHDLAAMLNLSFDEVHSINKNKKGTIANIKRLNHLKNNSPDKFQNEIKIIILKHFNIDSIELIKTSKENENKKT